MDIGRRSDNGDFGENGFPLEEAEPLDQFGHLMEITSKLAKVFRNLWQGSREISERSVTDP